MSWKGTLQPCAGGLHREHGGRTDVRIIDFVDTGYRDLAAGRVFASSGDFKADMAVLDRKEADGWK